MNKTRLKSGWKRCFNYFVFFIHWNQHNTRSESHFGAEFRLSNKNCIRIQYNFKLNSPFSNSIVKKVTLYFDLFDGIFSSCLFILLLCLQQFAIKSVILNRTSFFLWMNLHAIFVVVWNEHIVTRAIFFVAQSTFWKF